MKKPPLSVVVPVGVGRTLDVLESLKNQKPRVEIIIEQGPNPSRNRNRGAARSHADIIAFVDAHSILPSDWARRILSFFKRYPKTDIVGGPQLTPPDQGIFATHSGYALASAFGAASLRSRYVPTALTLHADERFLTSANLACRKKVLTPISFDETLYPGEDPKFVSDAKRAGFSLAYSPDIFIYHKRRPTIITFAKQLFNYGFSRPFKEPFFHTLRHPFFLIPSLFVLYLLFLLPLTLFSVFFLVPLGLYILLAAIFSLAIGLQNNDILAFFFLPFIFFTIHFSYGLGFISGTITKLIRP